jgi:hypothetical protein
MPLAKGTMVAQSPSERVTIRGASEADISLGPTVDDGGGAAMSVFGSDAMLQDIRDIRPGKGSYRSPCKRPQAAVHLQARSFLQGVVQESNRHGLKVLHVLDIVSLDKGHVYSAVQDIVKFLRNAILLFGKGRFYRVLSLI